MTHMQHKPLLDAADFFNSSARTLLTVDERPHAETLIASVARMSGSLLYRSFNADVTIKPGTAVFSEQANIHGPKLMNVMFLTLQQLGEKVSRENISSEYVSTKPSQLSFKESHDRLAPLFLKYCEAIPMAFQDAAFGAAIATGSLVYECREMLPVKKGCGIAVYGLLEGAKTAPFPLIAAEKLPPLPPAIERNRPWYRFW